MSSFDSFGGTSSNDEFCPNCGAIRVFSALVCPSCGVNYDEALKKKRGAEGNAQEEIVGRRFEEKPQIKDTAKQENAEDVKKPDPDDPIAKKLAEITRQNSGMMVGERRYRIDNTSSDPAKKTEEGSGDGTSLGNPAGPSGRSVYDQANNTYGNGNISYGASRYGGSVWQSGTSPATDHTPIGTSAKTYSNEVSNKYDEYRSDMNNPASSSQYASPYSRGAFDQVPEKKPSTLKKILPLAIILVLVGIGTGVFLWLRGLNTNENGIEYTKGEWNDSARKYTNEWADLNIDFSSLGDKYYANMALSNLLTEEEREKFDIPLSYENSTSQIGVTIITYKDGIFPIKESSLFTDEVGTVTGMGRSITYKEEPDALLGNHTYKCRSMEVKSNKVSYKYYYFARVIGNRAVYVMAYYSDTEADKLGLIKGLFK